MQVLHRAATCRTPLTNSCSSPYCNILQASIEYVIKDTCSHLKLGLWRFILLSSQMQMWVQRILAASSKQDLCGWEKYHSVCQIPTMMGIVMSKVSNATREAGPSWMYSSTIAPMILAGEEMTPSRFWQSCCRVSASEVTMLKMRPEVNCCWAVGVSRSTFLKTWCTRRALSLKPAQKGRPLRNQLRFISADSDPSVLKGICMMAIC